MDELLTMMWNAFAEFLIRTHMAVEACEEEFDDGDQD